MSGELDTRPDLVEQIRELRDKIRDLESRVNGDESGFDLSDLNDVRVDSLGDGTITLADGSALVFRSADKLWVPGGGDGASFPVGPYDDGDNTFVIEVTPNDLMISNVDDATVSYAQVELNVDTDDSLITIDAHGNNGDAKIQVGGSAGHGFILLRVDDGASHPANIALDSSGAVPTLGITIPAIIFKLMTSPIASGTLAGSQFSFWLDDTPGATTFNIKAKDSGGTVRTASIPLS